MGRARRVGLLLQNGGGAAAGVSCRCAGDLFFLWKHRSYSDPGTCGELFYLCISVKTNENVRFALVAEASTEVFTKDFSLQSKEEHACFTDFCCHSWFGQRRKEA